MRTRSALPAQQNSKAAKQLSLGHALGAADSSNATQRCLEAAERLTANACEMKLVRLEECAVVSLHGHCGSTHFRIPVVQSGGKK